MNHIKVDVLLCTYNGSRFIEEQINSIRNQTHRNLRIFISDDGSSDDTVKLLKSYVKLWGEDYIQIFSGPRNGYAQNFLSLLMRSELKGDYFCYCDQDDVWLPNKISRAIEMALASSAAGNPFLYCSRTIYINESGRRLGMSAKYAFPPTFRNALVQSIAGGNTMLFNHAALSLLRAAGKVDVVAHDWWTYICIAAADGVIYFDQESEILYRQHSESLVGRNDRLLDKISRLGNVIDGTYRMWIDKNLIALSGADVTISTSNRSSLSVFRLLRTAKFKDRIRLVAVSGIYRQTFISTLQLYFAIALNKL